MTAASIQRLLAFKHAQDLYISECKNGPTQNCSHRRLDGWCLIRTWSPVTFVGYEIKTSRSDWMGDQKLSDYLPSCHLLYVVAPKGIVDPRELPPTVGLMQASDKAIVTKHKAARREISADGVLDTLTYVLMARVAVKEENAAPQTREERIATWQGWLETNNQSKTVGNLARGRVGELYREMEQQVIDLRNRVQQCERIEQLIREWGFDPLRPFQSWRIEMRARELVGAVPDALIGDMTRTVEQMQKTIDRLVTFKAQPEAAERAKA
jgi:hypothetical protein